MGLTAEQKRTVKLARSPQPDGVQRQVVATVAGPGSGKTFLQERLAVRLRRKGHQRVLKLFFNRTAADDGRRRLKQALRDAGLQGGVKCLTTHAAALRYARAPMGADLPERCVDEAEYQRLVLETFDDKIASFHGERPEAEPPEKRDEARAVAARRSKLVAYWIFKTLTNFLASWETEQALLQPSGNFDGLTYYPAKLHHKQKLPKCLEREPGDWYRKRAHELWEMMTAGQLPIMHDVYLKWAQLRGMELGDFTAILLDEAQDCTKCQLDAFVNQPHHADVFVVGDMAQALYSWRLAKPEQLASLKESQGRPAWYHTLHGKLRTGDFSARPRRAVECTELRRTFRFGGQIGRVANCILYVKGHSEQSLLNKRLWVPYELVPDPAKHSKVVDEGGELSAGPRTIIGRTNVGIAIAAWRELGKDPEVRIAINGSGESSGAQKFRAVFGELRDCLRLFHGKRPKRAKFREFESWADFKLQVEERELGVFNMHVNLVEKYGWPRARPILLDKIEQFEESVLEADHDASDVDILLSTVCAAKGLEWARVEVLDDCIPLDVLSVVGKADMGDGTGERARVLFQPDHSGGDPSKPKQLDFKGDELNSWFVATTRAQEELKLPPKFWDLIRMVEARGPATEGQLAMWSSRGISSRPEFQEEALRLLDGLGEVWRQEGQDEGGGDSEDDEAGAEIGSPGAASTGRKRKRPG